MDQHPILTGDEEEEITDPAMMLLPTRADLEKQDAEAAAADGADDDTTDEVTEAEEAVYTPEVDDPGDYTPKDYSFEVNVLDGPEDNRKIKTVKITSPDDFDALLETDPEFENGSALLKAQRLATKMESNLDRDKSEYDKRKAAYDNEATAVQDANASVAALEAGLNYLVDRGELPSVAKKYLNADWTDPKVAEQPGVKEQLALLDYMAKENTARAKAGLQPFASVVDAYTQWDRDNAREVLKKAETETAEQRRQAAMRVGSSSPAPVSNIPKGVSVGRSFGTLDNLN